MSTENKEIKNPGTADSDLVKSISALLDETIKEVEALAKGDVSFSELRLQPDENGGMASEAGQSSDDTAGLKKEEMPEELKEKIEEKKDGEDKKEDDKEVEKAIPEELSEAKDKEEDKKDEHQEPDGDEDEDEKEMEKFMRMMSKAMVRLGIAKSDSEPKVEEVKLEKSEETKSEGEDLSKAQAEKIETLTKEIEGLKKTVDDISKAPVSGRRSLTGLKPIQKSEDEKGGSAATTLSKSQVIDKLFALQKSGDKRINPVLITKAEQARSAEEMTALVGDLIK